MLELPPDLEQEIREGAALRGQEIPDYILWLMERYESYQAQGAEELQPRAGEFISDVTQQDRVVENYSLG